MLDEKHQPVNKAAAKMEKLIRDNFEAVKFYDAVLGGNYDKALSSISETNDYSQLPDAYEYGRQLLTEVNSSLGFDAKSLSSNQLNDSVLYYDEDEMDEL